MYSHQRREERAAAGENSRLLFCGFVGGYSCDYIFDRDELFGLGLDNRRGAKAQRNLWVLNMETIYQG